MGRTPEGKPQVIIKTTSDNIFDDLIGKVGGMLEGIGERGFSLIDAGLMMVGLKNEPERMQVNSGRAGGEDAGGGERSAPDTVQPPSVAAFIEPRIPSMNELRAMLPQSVQDVVAGAWQAAGNAATSAMNSVQAPSPADLCTFSPAQVGAGRGAQQQGAGVGGGGGGMPVPG